eukprot:jgi/Pico_ML_1/54854/g712.t2
MDETVKQWTVEEPGRLEETYTYPEHSLGVVAVASAPGGNVVASSSLDSSIRVWNVEKFETYAVLANMPSETWSIQFSPDAHSKVVAAASGSLSGIHMYDSGNGNLIDTLSGHESWALSVSVHPGGPLPVPSYRPASPPTPRSFALWQSREADRGRFHHPSGLDVCETTPPTGPGTSPWVPPRPHDPDKPSDGKGEECWK